MLQNEPSAKPTRKNLGRLRYSSPSICWPQTLHTYFVHRQTTDSNSTTKTESDREAKPSKRCFYCSTASEDESSSIERKFNFKPRKNNRHRTKSLYVVSELKVTHIEWTAHSLFKFEQFSVFVQWRYTLSLVWIAHCLCVFVSLYEKLEKTKLCFNCLLTYTWVRILEVKRFLNLKCQWFMMYACFALFAYVRVSICFYDRRRRGNFLYTVCG